MRTLILLRPSRVERNKKAIEKKLRVKLDFYGKKVDIRGEEVDEFIAYRIIEALDAHFPFDIALLLLNEDFVLQRINIKDLSRRANLRDVRARVIGTNGRTMELIGELSDSYVEVEGNNIFVIGPADRIDITMHALEALVKGSKQSSVYSYLERQRKKYFDEKIELRE